MLAYVFWHWKRAEVTPWEYEQVQREFHRALGAAPPPGFDRSFSVALSGAPWASAGDQAYEDWYLVRDSAALDPLNEAAVTATRQRPHDAAAALAAGGIAGLYRVRLGVPPSAPGFAHWFDKPAGMSYSRLWELFTPLVEGGRGTLWIRHMVLGPSPEFCLHTPAATELPHEVVGRTLELRTVWSGGAAGPAA